MKLRQLCDNDVVFSLKLREDDSPFNFESGDKEADLKLKNELTKRLNNGDLWAWCEVTITATWHPSVTYNGYLNEWVGSSSLFGCSYESEEDFKCCGYYRDLCIEALEDLNSRISRVANQLSELSDD